ncbi:hypothetical protein NDQ56_13825, partial [Lactiplantibacillus plantarum]|nr:hypothetical protein [Lactiplantibacillus plantarum]
MQRSINYLGIQNDYCHEPKIILMFKFASLQQKTGLPKPVLVQKFSGKLILSIISLKSEVAMTNCQIKRNFVPKKTSNGLFQPN